MTTFMANVEPVPDPAVPPELAAGTHWLRVDKKESDSLVGSRGVFQAFDFSTPCSAVCPTWGRSVWSADHDTCH